MTGGSVEGLREGRRRILVVEDNALSQKLAADVLGAAGYDVDLASDGLEAVEAARGRAYDLVLMDIQMPRMNGFDAASAIRGARRDPAKPVILALSACVEDRTMTLGLAAGIDGFIAKPYGYLGLQRQISAIFARAAQAH